MLKDSIKVNIVWLANETLNYQYERTYKNHWKIENNNKDFDKEINKMIEINRNLMRNGETRYKIRENKS